VTEPGIASRTLLQASGQSLSEFEEIGGHTPYFLDEVQLPEPENSCLITNVIEPVNRVWSPDLRRAKMRIRLLTSANTCVAGRSFGGSSFVGHVEGIVGHRLHERKPGPAPER
jgi:hypothetical protein